MRIGIDARPLQGETQYRGIGMSLDYMLRALLAGPGSEHTYVFYVDGHLPTPRLLKDFPGHKQIVIPAAKLARRRYLRSVLSSYKPPRPRPRDVDVFLQYDASLGVPAGVPCVTVFYDLIPLLFRGKDKKQPVAGLRKYKNFLASSLYWQKYRRTFPQYKRADKIIAISEVSKQDYLKYTGSKQEVRVVHLSANDAGEPKAGKTTKELASKPYILYVGGIDLRKNVVALVRTFYELKKKFPDLRLLAVGKEFNLSSQLGDLGWRAAINSNKDYAKDILTPGFISDNDLAWLYAHAQAFVFPSRYEGFGLPVLEAMQAGCPVVAYDNSSIPEVAGDAALLVPDGESLVPALSKVLEDKGLRQELVAKGRARAGQFSWEQTAKETLAVLEEVGEEQNAPLRIAFDASCLVADGKSGVAHYTESLVRHLANEYPNRLEIVGHYCNFLGLRKNLSLPQAPNITYRPTKLVSTRVLNLLRRLRIWIPFELLIKGRADFHLFPAFIGWPSAFKTPSAPVIHDVTYLKFPGFVTDRTLYDLKRFVPAAIKRAAFVVTISEASAKSIREHYRLKEPETLVTLIPPVPIKHPSAETSSTQLKQLGVTSPYVLFLGNLEPRKNLVTLLDAYKILPLELRQRYALVLAGGKGWQDDEIIAAIADMKRAGYNIVQTGYVNNERRAVLLNGASAFVLPSHYEGFGMPLLEAMSCETPVIASDIDVFHEVCGDAALFFDPGSPQELAAQLERLLSDKQLAKRLIEEGRANLQRFSWPEVTGTIYKRIEEVV